MKDIKYYGIKPKRIIGPKGEVRFPYDVNGVVLPSEFSVTATITNGSFSGPSEILENEEGIGTITPNQDYLLPSSVTVVGASHTYNQSTGEITISNPTADVTIEAVCPIISYTLSVTVTDGTYTAPETIDKNGQATVTVVPDEGYVLPDSVTVAGATHVYDSTAGTISLSNPTGNVSVSVTCEQAMVIDPVLGNNSWEVIRAVCEAGNAGDYWALGDSKTVTVGSYSYPWTLVHMGDIYGTKKAVFMCGYRTESNIVWDADNSNNVTTADIWASLASGGTAYGELVDAELGAQLTDTTVQVATSGTDATLTTLTGKLFIPAEKELTATRAYSVSEEFAALTTFGYFAANDTNAARVRHKASAPEATSNQAYWTRSPGGGVSGRVVHVGSDGSVGYSSAYDAGIGVAPCFAF